MALLAPLDWGLGHATRCIPLIAKLLEAGFKVIVAAEGDQKILISAAFPGLEFVSLRGYGVRYGSSRIGTIVNIFLRIPGLLAAIRRERRWLKGLLERQQIDLVISDSRFGLCNKNSVCVFISHQLSIKTMMGKQVDRWVQRLNYHYINRFDHCWVPDDQDDRNLAGILSHPRIMPKIPVSYLGTLSRIQRGTSKSKYQLLVLLSGPEPQRSLLESKLLEQIREYTGTVIFVRGMPSAKAKPGESPTLTICDYLSGTELEDAIDGAEFVICRAGYSSLMDLLPLGKKCLLIPTPGQGEQEYLARLLAERGWACMQEQESFSLEAALQQLSFLQPPDLSNLKQPAALEKAIKEVKEVLLKKA